MEPIQQLYAWQSQVDKTGPNGAADMDVAKRLLKHGIECLEENAKLREQLEAIAPIGIIECAGCKSFTAIKDEGFDHVCPDCTISALREQLAVANLRLHEVAVACAGAEQRAEAAEAKLKAASKQEPIGIVRMSSSPDGTPKPLPKWIMTANQSLLKDGDYLYAALVPPVDVQELQKELDNKSASLNTIAEICTVAGCEDWTDLKRKLSEHAELERKRAEQQALILDARKICRVKGDKHGILNAVEAALFKTGLDELNTLLAQAREEGRNEAVPDGIISIGASFDCEGGGIFTPTLKLRFASGMDCNDLWILRDKAKAMLSASPKPE